jgi:hypothetical protein
MGLPKPAAFAFAACVLLLPFMALASQRELGSDPSRAIGSANEKVTDDAVKDFNADVATPDRSAMTLAVNGRIVASERQSATAVANKWNWTLLLLGCTGLVVSQLARRRSRRPMISS